MNTIPSVSGDINVKHIVENSGHPLEAHGWQTWFSSSITGLKAALKYTESEFIEVEARNLYF